MLKTLAISFIILLSSNCFAQTTVIGNVINVTERFVNNIIEETLVVRLKDQIDGVEYLYPVLVGKRFREVGSQKREYLAKEKAFITLKKSDRFDHFNIINMTYYPTLSQSNSHILSAFEYLLMEQLESRLNTQNKKHHFAGTGTLEFSLNNSKSSKVELISFHRVRMEPYVYVIIKSYLEDAYDALSHQWPEDTISHFRVSIIEGKIRFSKANRYSTHKERIRL
jgi:hypothetical protein